ncbi:hypothetical protein ADUPG1_003482, partial [Aduncisulcus paluster]
VEKVEEQRGKGFEVGQKVWVEPIVKRKGDPEWTGPFKIKQKITDFKYLITTLDDHLDQEVHVARLKLCTADASDEELLSLQAADEGQYVVEAILDHGINELGKMVFLVKWFGFQDDENTWQDYSPIYGTTAIVNYIQEHPEVQKWLCDDSKIKQTDTIYTVSKFTYITPFSPLE